MVIVGFVIFAITAILFALLAEEQRRYFGEFSGNCLLGAEVASVVMTALVVSLWRRGGRTLSIALGLWSAALFCAFLAWFVHPEQVMSRAEERLSDWEFAINEYKIYQAYGRKHQSEATHFQRFATELAARRNEYQAALMRYKGDPAFFRSNFYSWVFGVIGAIFAIAGMVALRMRRLAHPP